jgi:hypothetical protein
MRKTIAVCLIVIIGLPLIAQEKMDLELEKKAVKEAALNYIEGWYEGSVERMDKALHPDLVKRVMRTMPTGKEITNSVSKKSMIEYVRAGAGKEAKEADKKCTVTVLDIHGTIASVKTVTGEFIDYIHLAKTEGEWKIMNVLWIPAKPSGK